MSVAVPGQPGRSRRAVGLAGMTMVRAGWGVLLLTAPRGVLRFVTGASSEARTGLPGRAVTCAVSGRVPDDAGPDASRDIARDIARDTAPGIPTGVPADVAVTVAARVLGARHLAQAAVTFAMPTRRWLQYGVAIDVAHAASMAGLAGLHGSSRRVALISAMIAAAFAGAGLGVLPTVRRVARSSR